jgi:uncharacterized protein
LGRAMGSTGNPIYPPSGPSCRDALLFEADGEPNLFVVNGSMLYGVDAATALEIEESILAPGRLGALLTSIGVGQNAQIDDSIPEMPMRSISLAIAQKCNLGCSYCYAEGGSFGTVEKAMPFEVAARAVQQLVDGTPAGQRINIAFLGGEPLTNRQVLRAVTEFASRTAAAKGVTAGFSITTNATLLTEEDGAFFEEHGFAVTVSIDGIGAAHDRLRPFKGGRGSFDRIINRVRPVLSQQERMQVSARVTVTPANLNLRETLDGLIELGFHSVGFSPMLASPTGRQEMNESDLRIMLTQMIDCGRAFEQHFAEEQRYPFANMTNAMREIHKGTHRPYPCGAGASYLGVSADGDLFACHRFVGDDAGAMGNVVTGVDVARQQRWLQARHVHFQDPCNACWARYLCGGGCHHEVIRRGRPACDYIRGWLHYCLQAYVRLLKVQPPEHFGVSVGKLSSAAAPDP